METYEDIKNRMVQRYAQLAGFMPAEESDIMLRLQVLAGELYRLTVSEAYIDRQLFPTTAAGAYLDRHAAERGLNRRAATCATGTVYFYPAETPHPEILIPAGTEVCTSSDMRRFTTDTNVLLLAGENSVSADVTAAEPGAAGNVRAGTVNVIVTPVSGIGRVSNALAFENGTDAESDDQLRARVIDSYVNIVSGANAAYYKSIAMSDPQVYSASVVGCGRGNGTVDVYISGRGSRVTQNVRNRVQRMMDEARPLNVDVLVRDPDSVAISLYIVLRVAAGYEFNDVSAQVQTAVTDYINSLGVGEDVRLSRVGEVIYHSEGVADFRFLESYGSDRPIGDGQFAAAHSIVVREMA